MMRPPWRAIRHYFFIGAAGLSLLVCAGLSIVLAVQWVHGFERDYLLAQFPPRYFLSLRIKNRQYRLDLFDEAPSEILVAQSGKQPTPAEFSRFGPATRFECFGLKWDSDSAYTYEGTRSGLLGPFYAGWSYDFTIPSQLLIVIFAILPLCGIYRRIRLGAYGQRNKPGFCAKCGYDLRASKDRCPECGTAIPAPLQAETS